MLDCGKKRYVLDICSGCALGPLSYSMVYCHPLEFFEFHIVDFVNGTSRAGLDAAKR